MRGAVLTLALHALAVIAGCRFDHGVPPGTSGGDGGSTDGPSLDTPPQPLQITVGTIASDTIFYSDARQIDYTVASGTSLLLVGLSISFAGTTAQYVRWNGMDLVKVGAINAPSQDGRVEIWRMIDPAPGAHQLDVSISNGSSAVIVGIVSLSNTHPTAALGTFTTATGSIGDPTVALSSGSGELGFAVVMWNGNYATLVPSPAQTERWNIGASDVIGAGATQPGAGTTTLRWTVTNRYNDYWAVGAVSIKPSLQ